MVELSIEIKNEERTSKHKHLVYEPIQITEEDATLQKLVADARKLFGEDPIEDIVLKFRFNWMKNPKDHT